MKVLHPHYEYQVVYGVNVTAEVAMITGTPGELRKEIAWPYGPKILVIVDLKHNRRLDPELFVLALRDIQYAK